MNTKIDTERINEGVNLIDLAGRYTTLRRESAAEMAGPCPKCGGDDRFHVKQDTFFCRNCYPLGNGSHDAIGFMRWLRGLSFVDACQALSGGALPVAAGEPVTPKKAGRAGGARLSPMDAQRIAKEAAAALPVNEDGPGQAYLTGRGLWPETWEIFGLGYRLAGKTGIAPRPAICMPWALSSGRIVAIRYRFVTPHAEERGGKTHITKLVAEGGSRFSGHLFGGCALSGPDNVPALVLCEGEINAMSIWQVTAGALDVLSLGSEGQRLTPAAVTAIRQYKRVIVWADRGEVARAALASLPGAVGFRSPYDKDANDWLQAGRLCEILERLVYGGNE